MLPVIKEECLWPVSKEIKDDPDFLKNYMDHLHKVNPNAAHLITVLSESMPPCCKIVATVNSLMLYKVLENQAEADKMELDF